MFLTFLVSSYCTIILHNLGVNFINVLQAAFAPIDPKNVKRYWLLDCILTLLGAMVVKAVHKYVDEFEPSIEFYIPQWILRPLTTGKGHKGLFVLPTTWCRKLPVNYKRYLTWSGPDLNSRSWEQKHLWHVYSQSSLFGGVMFLESHGNNETADIKGILTKSSTLFINYDSAPRYTIHKIN